MTEDGEPDGNGSPRTDLSPVVAACEAADADAFVAVGDRSDDGLRYLTRFAGPDREYALVVVPDAAGRKRERVEAVEGDERGRAVLCAPSLYAEQARREFVDGARRDDGPFHDGVTREVRTENGGDPAGERAAAVVREACDEGSEPVRIDEDDANGATDGATVLVPRSIPHDAAVYLERAGATLASTAVVDEARAIKSAAEIGRLRRVQHAAARAMAHAETVLAESEVRSEREVRSEPDDEVVDAAPGPVLVWNDELLTTERLRREANAALALGGVRDAGNTVIESGSGSTAADRHDAGTDPIRPGETVLIDVSPRGPHGYHGDMTRTFVVDGDGGWERRASVAVEAAREAALDEIEPGVAADAVHRESAAELAAYGFDPNATEGVPGFTHGTGHGVGMSLHEAPSLSSDTELRPGHVVAIEPGVYDPETGGVRLGDLIVVTDDGSEVLAEYPLRTVPESR
ncbi:M24 family metallopeptidase [Halorubrum sp. DTA98]|uniref:M24 family metallopeptidase n=1 Tax=Halorubrum sp. DTA98 TaxID=3402163 RepID=UPI003AAEBDAE